MCSRDNSCSERPGAARLRDWPADLLHGQRTAPAHRRLAHHLTSLDLAPAPAVNGQYVVERCAGSKRFVMHAEQTMTAADAQLFCRQAYGPNAKLAEVATAAELLVVKSLSLEVRAAAAAAAALLLLLLLLLAAAAPSAHATVRPRRRCPRRPPRTAPGWASSSSTTAPLPTPTTGCRRPRRWAGAPASPTTRAAWRAAPPTSTAACSTWSATPTR
jgi:hypothetical protein